MRPTIIVFAKAPVPGRVKTRLGLNPEEAAALHERWARMTIESALRLQDAADVELHTDCETAAWSGLDVRRGLQPPGDLGARMLAALAGRGHPVMVLGSDAPTLPESYLRGILASPADVTLGPTEDGGYYAIFARRTHPGMFAGVEWSTPRALEQTISACRACGLSTALGERWFDIDTPEDLKRLNWKLHGA